MAYTGFVVEIKELKKHSNADKLQIATVFGNDVCVGLEVNLGDKMIYFPCDGQLSIDFCKYNHLCRKVPDAQHIPDTGYMDPDKRNVKAIKLRGEKSDGILCPLSSLDYIKHDELNVGDTISIINGVEVCCKYIPRSNSKEYSGNVSKTRKHKAPIAPLFTEHVDTEQLMYNLDHFKPGDIVEITLKMHGTSQRTGYLPTLKKYKKSLLDIILRREGTPIYDWGYVTGTRRTVIDGFEEGGFYGSNEFREQHAKFLEGKLHKGETVYYEVVGWCNEQTPIMPKGNNKKVGDDFVKKYGTETYFTYGNEQGQSSMYVYRMTMTNEDGDVVEYSPDFMRYRCEQMGVNTVPVFTKFIIPEFTQLGDGVGSLIETNAGEYVKKIAEEFYDGPDPVGKTHVREGVVCRIINRPSFTAYKTKNFSFKVLEGIIKESAENADMEEAQELEQGE